MGDTNLGFLQPYKESTVFAMDISPTSPRLLKKIPMLVNKYTHLQIYFQNMKSLFFMRTGTNAMVVNVNYNVFKIIYF